MPEILAAIIIANNPTQYGFDDFTLDPPVLTDTVTINYSHRSAPRVRHRGRADGRDGGAQSQPPALRHAPDASFDLHLPAGTGALFEKRIAAIPESRRNSWRYHRVAADDTLASVAHSFHVSVPELAAANQLNETDSIGGMEALVIPVAPAAAPSMRTMLYTARRGDTLVTIADRFGVSLDQLRRWNNIAGSKVEPGRRLHVAEAASLPRAARTTRGHRRGAAAADASEEPGAKTRTHEAHAERGMDKEPAAPGRHKKGRASAAKRDRAEKPAPAAGARKSGASSAKSNRAEKPATKLKSSKRKQK